MPKQMLAEKNFNTVPYIVGVNKQEFGWLLPLVRKRRPRRVVSPAIISPLPSVAISPLISLVTEHFFLQTPLWDQGSCPLHTKVDISTETISNGPRCHLGDVALGTRIPTHSVVVLPSMNPEMSVPGGLVEIITGQMTNPRPGQGKGLGSSGEQGLGPAAAPLRLAATVLSPQIRPTPAPMLCHLTERVKGACIFLGQN